MYGKQSVQWKWLKKIGLELKAHLVYTVTYMGQSNGELKDGFFQNNAGRSKRQEVLKFAEMLQTQVKDLWQL